MTEKIFLPLPMSKYSRICVLCVLSVFLSVCYLWAKVTPAYAAVPKMLNYQGRLTDGDDVLLTTTNYFQFEIYDSLTNGNLLWSSQEDFASDCGVAVTPSNGVFNVIVGDDAVENMSDLDIDFNTATYYLQIKISATQGSDVACESPGAGASYETLDPRQRIASSGYSINADTVDGADADLTPEANEIPILDASGDLVLGSAASNDDDIIYFDDGSAEYIMWDDADWPLGANIGDGAGFVLSDDLALLGNIVKNVDSSDLVINSTGTSAGIRFQVGGTNRLTISANGDVSLNDTTYGYLTYASIVQPTGATGLTYYDSSDDMMLYYDGGISYWRSMQGVSIEMKAPAYPNSVLIPDGTSNSGTMVTGDEQVSDIEYTFYKWTTNKSTLQDYDIVFHLRVPDNFMSWASNAVTLYYKTGLVTEADNYVYWEIYEDGTAAALMTSGNMTSTSWTSDSATSAELSALTAGNTYRIVIRLFAKNTASAASYAGKVLLNYR